MILQCSKGNSEKQIGILVHVERSHDCIQVLLQILFTIDKHRLILFRTTQGMPPCHIVTVQQTVIINFDTVYDMSFEIWTSVWLACMTSKRYYNPHVSSLKIQSCSATTEL
jgi:hypothetical protein